MAQLVGLLRRGYRKLRGRPDNLANSPLPDPEYWEERTARFGRRAVVHLGHTDAEVDAVTRRQEEVLFPLLASALNGAERVILDFGCGFGRFTPGLARVAGGRAVGVDPSPGLLELAPRSDGVEYRRMEGGRVPLPEGSVDAVWTAVVLGCITEDPDVRFAASEILRVLRPGGVLFLAENTSDKPSGKHFVFRTADAYRELFRPVPLECVSTYEDLGETISVLVGRKPA